MLVTMTLDFDLPRDATAFAAVCMALEPGRRAPDVQLSEEAPGADAVEPVMTPGAVARKRGRPAKTAVVPLPDTPSTGTPPAEPTETISTAAAAPPEPDLFGENTRHYQEPAPTLDDVKAALQVYFQKDRAGAIALVQSYGVQQFAHIPPEKFAEFIAKCKAASA